MKKNELMTPCYIIDRAAFIKNCKEVMNHFTSMWGSNMIFGYSIKTNNSIGLMKIAGELGWYPEAVSCDEMNLAKSLGVQYKEIIFNGPVKGNMLEEACKNGAIVNLDNMKEVQDVCRKFKDKSSSDLKIGLRVNFDLEKLCPGETSAGEESGRFGISYENGDLKKAVHCLNHAGIRVSGLHMHTSTKTRSIKVFSELANMVCRTARELSLELSYIDMGGGFFGGQKIQGKPEMKEYAEAICGILKTCFEPEKTTLILEPGASVIATAVEYISKVDNIRSIRENRIVTLDGTLLHINPFMARREPVYEIENQGSCDIERQFVCGCTCMENDRFFEIQNGNELTEESYVVFKNAGAYTMGFNSHFIIAPPAVYIRDSDDEYERCR